MDNTANTPIESKIIPTNFSKKKLFIIAGIIILIIVFLLVLSMNNLLPFGKKQVVDTTVQLKTEYKNPFDEKTQYKNPFSKEEYQNPFDFGQ